MVSDSHPCWMRWGRALRKSRIRERATGELGLDEIPIWTDASMGYHLHVHHHHALYQTSAIACDTSTLYILAAWHQDVAPRTMPGQVELAQCLRVCATVWHSFQKLIRSPCLGSRSFRDRFKCVI